MEADATGRPLALGEGQGRLAVEAVLDRWRIDDEWWRERPVSRMYWRLLLADGRTATVYQDLVDGRWWIHNY